MLSGIFKRGISIILSGVLVVSCFENTSFASDISGNAAEEVLNEEISGNDELFNSDFEDVSVNEEAEKIEDTSENEYEVSIVESGRYKNVEWTIDSNGLLTVSGTGEFAESDYDSHSRYVDWQQCGVTIKSAKIKLTGTKNASFMFYGCSKLVSVDFSEFDTSSVTNMSYMFGNCSGLKKLDLKNIDTSNVENMSGMFWSCSNLESIDMKGWDTSNVTDMSDMFWGCAHLKTLDVTGFNTSKVEKFASMFALNWQSTLTKLDVSHFDTSSATDMSDMFRCPKVEIIDVSGFDTSNVTDMSQMFDGCESVKELNVSKFNTSKVENMGSMFEGCYNLETLDVSNFDTSKVTRMDLMFLDCSKLKKLDVSGFDTSNVTDMMDMFVECSSLKSLDVSGFDTSKVTNMQQMFRGCSGLTNIDISNFDTSKVTNFSGMFSGCSLLKNIDVSGFDTSCATTMGEMFYGCTSLTQLDLTGFVTEKVKRIAWLFKECAALTSIDLSQMDLGNAIYCKEVFWSCGNLYEIKCPLNVVASIALPDNSGTWRDSKGNTYTELPKNLKESITITRSISSAKITYNNCEDAVNPNPSSYPNGVKVTLLPASKPGYIFSYWYCKKGKKEVKITEIPATSTQDYVLYAKWAPCSYKVSFLGNVTSVKDYYMGTREPAITGKMKVQSITAGKGTQLSANQFKIKGYDFVGWNTKADGSGDSYANKEKIVYMADDPSVLTMYAQWKKTEYAIEYKGLSDGEIDKFSLPRKYQIDSLTIDYSSLAKDVEREGYVFKGFYKDKKYMNKYKSIAEGSTGNKTVYVKFTANKYKLSFVQNQESIKDFKGTAPKKSGSMKAQTVTYGVETAISKNAFKVTGYNFVGWNTKPDGSGDSYSDREKITNLTSVPNETITLYAQWEKAIYSINYAGLSEKEIDDFALPKSYMVDDPDIIFSDYSGRMVREGYKFKNWYKDKKYKTVFKNINTGSTGNKTIYVRFEPNKYKVVFDRNEGSISKDEGTKLKCKGTMKKQTVTYGKSTQLSNNGYTISGYIFLGWDTYPDGTGNRYANKEKVLNLSSVDGDEITLYAQWGKK